MHAKLFISSASRDADLFLIVRVFDPDGDEVTFQGALEPHSRLRTAGCELRTGSLTATASTAHRPYHTHVDPQPLEPGRGLRARRRDLAVLLWSYPPVTPSH